MIINAIITAITITITITITLPDAPPAIQATQDEPMMVLYAKYNQ